MPKIGNIFQPQLGLKINNPGSAQAWRLYSGQFLTAESAISHTLFSASFVFGLKQV